MQETTTDHPSSPAAPAPPGGPLSAPASPGPSPAIPWGAGDIAIAIACVIGVVFLAAIVTLPFALEDTGRDRDLEAWAVVALTAVLDIVLVSVAWAFSVKKYRVSWSALGFRKISPGAAGRALVKGLFATLVIALVYGLAAQGLGLDDELKSAENLDDIAGGTKLGLVLLAVIAAPLAEETFFRGFIFNGFKGRLGVKWAAAGAAALFALAHLHPLTYLPIFSIGLVLAWVMTSTGSIASAMLVHAAYNGVVVAFAW